MEFQSSAVAGEIIPYIPAPGETQLPVASFNASKTSGAAPLSVEFDASASYDTDGTIQSYYWTFGDGTEETGNQISHIFTKEGTYNVTLVIRDNKNATGRKTARITVSTALVAPTEPAPEEPTDEYRVRSRIL